MVSNQGKPLTEYKKELTKLAPQLNVHSPKDSQKNELSNDSISDILHLFATMYKQENDLGFEKIAAGIIAAGRLPLLGDTFINDLSMREIIPSYLERAVDDIKTTKIRRMGAFEEARFMAFLSMLIRNDEVAIKGKSVSNRVSRVGIISKFIFGRANLHHFDPQFPDANVGRSELFKTDVTYMDSCWPVLHRFLAMRIQTHQFFGPHYQGLRFFEGLQYLHLIAVSTIALAKWHALALGRITVTEEQIKKSLAWCDHNYGKSQLLKTKPAVILARQCMDIDNNMRQLNGILAFRLT